MRFYARKRKQAPAVIIVALIDILIVLLIFLMVTTTFNKQQQQALKVVLPESSHSEKVGAQESPPLLVSIDAQGSYRLGPQNTPVTLEQLKPALMAEVAKTPDIKVAINSDEAAPVGRFIKVMDAVRDSGVKQANVLTKEPAKQ